METCEVAVLGAGLAGLCAARDLQEANVNVVLLEGRDRVGGRTWSKSFDAPGCIVDLGAEWVAPQHHTALVKELTRYGLGLELNEVASDATVQTLSRSETSAFTSLLSRLDKIAQTVNVRDPAWYRSLDSFDLPVTEYLEDLDLEPEDESLLLANGFALQGAGPAQYSLINLLHEFASFGSSEEAFYAAECRIEGGAQALSIALAEVLGARLRLNWRVDSVSQTDSGLMIQGPSAQLHAQQVVIALPVNVMRDLTLDLPLPQASLSVIARGHVGRAAKGWAGATMPNSVESTGWPNAVEVYCREGSRSRAVCTFAVAAPNHEQALEASWAAVSQRHPEVTLTGEFLSHDWLSDPFAKGSWLSAAPGQSSGLHQLADAPPPCVFAGGDLSRGWYGWMEGAVTSGADAASRILAYRERGEKLPASA